MTAGASAAGLARNRSRAAFLAAVAEARRVSKPGSLKLISVHLVRRVCEAPANAPADIKEAAPRQGGFATVAKATAPSRFLSALDVVDGDLAGAAVLGGVESHLLAFGEAAHAGALERRRMDEHVLAAVVRLDEAEAFLIVVEFHGARGHGVVLRFR